MKDVKFKLKKFYNGNKERLTPIAVFTIKAVYAAIIFKIVFNVL